MRLIATSDLHYNIERSRRPTEELAEQVCASAADALVLIGDIAGADKAHFDECLRLFAPFAGAKLFIAGNHSLWSGNGEDATWLLRDELPRRGRELGFSCLEYEPAIIGGVGIVGTIGWYDYSLRHEPLGVPMRFYEHKVAPGAARYYKEHRGLLAQQDDLRPGHYNLTMRWMDGVNVKLPVSDADFTRMLADKLAAQLDDLAPRVDRIVAVTHHVPCACLMPQMPNPQFLFVSAFMGSELFGQVCQAQPKVTHILCGHTHQSVRATMGHIECISVGSDYRHKRLVEIEA